jgi:hypothetical protein
VKQSRNGVQVATSDHRGQACAKAKFLLLTGVGRDAPKPDPQIAAARERDRQRNRAAAEAAKDATQRIAGARRRWGQRKPLAGTVGAAYLASRDIKDPVGGWPECVAFLSVRSIHVWVRNDAGKDVLLTFPTAGGVMVSEQLPPAADFFRGARSGLSSGACPRLFSAPP